MRHSFRHLWLVLFVLALAGCAPSIEIPFATVPLTTTSTPPDSTTIVDSRPRSYRDFFVVASDQDALLTTQWLSNNPDVEFPIARLENVDYDTSFAIVAYHGMTSTGGYSIEVRRITVHGSTMEVNVRTYRPCEQQGGLFGLVLGCPVTLMVEYPMQIVEINYSDLPTLTGPGYTFEFFVNGRWDRTIHHLIPPGSE